MARILFWNAWIQQMLYSREPINLASRQQLRSRIVTVPQTIKEIVASVRHSKCNKASGPNDGILSS